MVVIFVVFIFLLCSDTEFSAVNCSEMALQQPKVSLRILRSSSSPQKHAPVPRRPKAATKTKTPSSTPLCFAAVRGIHHFDHRCGMGVGLGLQVRTDSKQRNHNSTFRQRLTRRRGEIESHGDAQEHWRRQHESISHSPPSSECKRIATCQLKTFIVDALRLRVIQSAFLGKHSQRNSAKTGQKHLALLLCAKVRCEYRFKLLLFEDDTLSKLATLVSFSDTHIFYLIAPKSASSTHSSSAAPAVSTSHRFDDSDFMKRCSHTQLRRRRCRRARDLVLVGCALLGRRQTVAVGHLEARRRRRETRIRRVCQHRCV